MAENRIYQALKQRLMSLELEPNSPVQISEICESMSVSHIPVREALAVLAMEGWVHHIPNRGYFARAIDADTIVHCYDCLEVILVKSLSCRSPDMRPPPLSLTDHDGLFQRLQYAVHGVRNSFLCRVGMASLEQVKFILAGLWVCPETSAQIRLQIGDCDRLVEDGKLYEAEQIIYSSFDQRRNQVVSESKYGLNFALQMINVV